MGGARTAFWPRGMATLAVPIFLIQYAGQPFPGSMIAKETGLELPDLLVLGLVTPPCTANRFRILVRQLLLSKRSW